MASGAHLGPAVPQQTPAGSLLPGQRPLPPCPGPSAPAPALEDSSEAFILPNPCILLVFHLNSCSSQVFRALHPPLNGDLLATMLLCLLACLEQPRTHASTGGAPLGEHWGGHWGA